MLMISFSLSLSLFFFFLGNFSFWNLFERLMANFQIMTTIVSTLYPSKRHRFYQTHMGSPFPSFLPSCFHAFSPASWPSTIDDFVEFAKESGVP